METTHASLPLPDNVGRTFADRPWVGGLRDPAIPCPYCGFPPVSHRMRKFEAEAAWDLIARLEIRRLFLPPTALGMMRQVAVPDGVRVRLVGSGGESLGADLLEWGRDVLGASIIAPYGQTECALVVGSNAAAGVQRAGVVGRAVPEQEIAVRRGDPAMFLRYWNQSEKTAAKFRGDWMRARDPGRMDADGYIAFTARDDDVITSAGYRIVPSEIEACLCRDPRVLMAAVAGLPDADRTGAATAFMVPDCAPQDGSAEAPTARVKAELSPHMAPSAVHFATRCR